MTRTTHVCMKVARSNLGYDNEQEKAPYYGIDRIIYFKIQYGVSLLAH